MEQIVQNGSENCLQIHPSMTEKSSVFNCQNSLNQMRRNILIMDQRSLLPLLSKEIADGDWFQLHGRKLLPIGEVLNRFDLRSVKTHPDQYVFWRVKEKRMFRKSHSISCHRILAGL